MRERIFSRTRQRHTCSCARAFAQSCIHTRLCALGLCMCTLTHAHVRACMHSGIHVRTLALQACLLTHSHDANTHTRMHARLLQQAEEAKRMAALQKKKAENQQLFEKHKSEAARQACTPACSPCTRAHPPRMPAHTACMLRRHHPPARPPARTHARTSRRHRRRCSHRRGWAGRQLGRRHRRRGWAGRQLRRQLRHPLRRLGWHGRPRCRCAHVHVEQKDLMGHECLCTAGCDEATEYSCGI